MAVNVQSSTSFAELRILCKEKKPDLIIIDLGLPDVSGLDAVKFILAEYPSIKVVILTASNDVDILNQAVKSGAHAVLKKSETIEKLQKVLNWIFNGKPNADAGNRNPLASNYVYIDPLIEKLLKNQQGQNLSKREYDVAVLVTKGFTSQQIADRLQCTLSTIKTYRERLFNKSGCQNSAEFIAWFLKRHSN